MPSPHPHDAALIAHSEAVRSVTTTDAQSTGAVWVQAETFASSSGSWDEPGLYVIVPEAMAVTE